MAAVTAGRRQHHHHHGVKQLEQLEANLMAVELTLSQDDLDNLSIAGPSLEYPGTGDVAFHRHPVPKGERRGRRPCEDRFLPRAGSIRAGDRVPGAPLVMNDGGATTLFEQMYNPDDQSWETAVALLNGAGPSNHPLLAATADASSSHTWIRPLLVIADLASTGDAPLIPVARDLDQTAHQVLELGGPADLPALIEHVATFAASMR